MRLLIVTTVAGTLKAFLLPYAEYFRSLGWQVDALACHPEDCPECASSFSAVYHVNWSRKVLENLGILRAMSTVRRIIAAGNYDIVHVHTPVAAFVTRIALALPVRGKRPRVIYTAHGFHFQPGNSLLTNLLFSAMERLAGRWTDYLVVINQLDFDTALSLRIVPPERLYRMPGIGIDRRFFSPCAASRDEIARVPGQFGIPQGAVIFVMVAEFLPRKRHSDVVRALTLMHSQEAHVIFVGDGPGMAETRDLSLNLGVGERVHFAGPQPDVRPFILAARATILASSQEGLPRSVMESLCCGVPVIGSDIRGIRDLLASGGGDLYPCGDARALASRLDAFARKVDGARELGRQVRERMAPYAIGNIIRLHEDLYALAGNEPKICSVVASSRSR